MKLTLDWIEDMSIKRLSQRTNIFIVETNDLRSRVQAFKKFVAGSNISKAFGREYDEIVNYNLNRNQMFHVVSAGKDKKGWAPIPMEMGSNPLQMLDGYLTTQKSIVVIDYVVFQSHADVLGDSIIAWSHDEKLYDKKSTGIIFTNNVNLFPEALRNLCYPIIIPASTAEERETKGKQLVKDLTDLGKQGGKTYNLKVTPELIQQSAGLGLDPFETAMIESFRQEGEFKTEYITKAKIDRLKAANMIYSEPTIGFDRIGGYEAFKDLIRNSFIKLLKQPDKAKYYGLETPRGLLIFGPPGCGKSIFSEALAKEVGLAMIKLNPADLLRGYVGESESRTRQVTLLLESLAPILIHVDEFDAMAPARDKVMMTDSGAGRRVTNQLLEWMGDRNRRSFIVGTTNYLGDIDEAMIRPGNVNGNFK